MQKNKCSTISCFNQQQISVQQEGLLNVGIFQRILEINLDWNNFSFILNLNPVQQHDHYSLEVDGSVKFISQYGNSFSFYPSTDAPPEIINTNMEGDDESIQKKLSNPCFYSDKKYSLAIIFYNYLQRISNENQRLSSEKKHQTNLQFIHHFDLEIANHFMIALNQERRYQNMNEVVWVSWKTYWSKPNHQCYCYSNCPGVCTPKCNNFTCYYYLPPSEATYSQLPDCEKIDPRNIYDPDLFWLARIFFEFVHKEEYEE